MRFEDSFAGLLSEAGRARAQKVEFLNAGVIGYSPVIYLQKVRFLLENGLKFDEVVVLLDVSDVAEEATRYFCIDDDPRYRSYCSEERAPGAKEKFKVWLRRNFIILNRTRLIIYPEDQKRKE